MRGKELSTKKLKIACERVCEKNAEDFRHLDTDGVVLSNDLLKRVDALLAEDKEKKPKCRLRAKRILITVTIALLAAVIACMSISAIREKIIHVFVTSYERYFGHEYDTAEPSDQPEEFEVKLPTYVPEGYELAENSSRWNYVQAVYKNPKDSSKISYKQKILGSTQYNLNNENVDIREISIGSYTGTAVISKDSEFPSCILLWNDGTYEFYLSTNLSLEEALLIAESIN